MQIALVVRCLFQAPGAQAMAIRNKTTRTATRGMLLMVGVVLSALPSGQVVAQETSNSPRLTLMQARTLARGAHPAIDAARRAVEGAAGVEKQSGAFPNPTVEFSREQTSGTGGTNWQNLATFGQPLEIGGQRGARLSAARHRRAAAEAHLATTEAQLDFEVGRAFALAIAANERAARTAEAAAVFSLAREMAAARLAEGDISGYEYRRIGLEAGRYAALEAEMILERQTARLALATLIAPSSDAISALAADIRLVDPVPTSSVAAPLDSLVALAFHLRPDLREAGFDFDASIADLRLASRKTIPTPTVAFGFLSQRTATDLDVSRGFTVQVALPIPLWNRQGGATAAARAESQRIEATREELHRSIAREVEHAWRMYATATEQLQILQPFLGTEAQLALTAAGTAYTEGEISLVEWLDAVRAFHEAQSSFATVKADHLIRHMALERAVGAVLGGGTE